MELLGVARYISGAVERQRWHGYTIAEFAVSFGRWTFGRLLFLAVSLSAMRWTASTSCVRDNAGFARRWVVSD